jgi:hypothetical protein
MTAALVNAAVTLLAVAGFGLAVTPTEAAAQSTCNEPNEYRVIFERDEDTGMSRVGVYVALTTGSLKCPGEVARLERGGVVIAEESGSLASGTDFGGVTPQPGDVVRILFNGETKLVESYGGPLTIDHGACRGSLIVGGRVVPGYPSPFAVTIGRGKDWLTVVGDRWTMTPDEPLWAGRHPSAPPGASPASVEMLQSRKGNLPGPSWKELPRFSVTYHGRQRVTNACPGQKPIPTSTSCRLTAAGTCTVKLSCPAGDVPCTARLSSAGRRTVRAVTASIPPAGSRKLRVALTPRVRRDVRRGGTTRLGLRATLTAGATVRQRHRLWLVVRAPRRSR